MSGGFNLGRRWAGASAAGRARTAPPSELYLTQRDKREILSKLVMRETTYRYAIAGFVVLFALIGSFTLMSKEGPHSAWELAVALSFFASTIPVGIAMIKVNHAAVWWSDHVEYRWAPELLVVYADIGLTATLGSFRSASLALFGCLLFAVIGTYVAHFVSALARALHILASSCVIVGFGWWGLHDHAFDFGGAAARVLTALFAVNGTVALHSIYTTEVRRAIAAKHTHANTDPLTGIANRRAFNTRARGLIETAEHGVDVVLIDVDNFKTVNDTHGHTRGDELLVDVAWAILSAFDSTAVVGRLGGDEFAVAIPVFPEQHQDADELRQRIVELSKVPVSVGCALTDPTESDSSEALSAALTAADMDLYAAKKTRKRRQGVLLDDDR